MSDDNWYDEGIGSVKHIQETMKSYNAYQPPSLDEILKRKLVKEEEKE